MRLSKKIISAVATLSLAASILLPPQIVSAANSVTPTCLSDTAISPLADAIRWVYYTAEDGKTYKRLYNYSTRDWIGEWILVSG